MDASPHRSLPGITKAQAHHLPEEPLAPDAGGRDCARAGEILAQLKDPETSKVIYNFTEEKGGVEAVKNKLRRQGPALPLATVDIKNPEINNVRFHNSHSVQQPYHLNNMLSHSSLGCKKKLTKADIGTPTNFQHICHIGWDPNTGFDLNNLDPDLKNLFNVCDISEAQLKDPETSKVIYDFIEEKGGVEAVKSKLKRQATPPSPSSGEAPSPPHNMARTPPPRPSSKRQRPPPPPQDQNSVDEGTGEDAPLDQVDQEIQLKTQDNLDLELKNQLCHSIYTTVIGNISEAQLEDSETSKDFIEEKGGVEAVKNKLRTQSPPPSPSGGAPPPSSPPHNTARSSLPQSSRWSQRLPPPPQDLNGVGGGTGQGTLLDQIHQEIQLKTWSAWQLSNLDPELKNLFHISGISEAQLKDPDTSNVICAFIEKKGGVEAVKNELRRQAPPPSPSSGEAPSLPSGTGEGAALLNQLDQEIQLKTQDNLDLELKNRIYSNIYTTVIGDISEVQLEDAETQSPPPPPSRGGAPSPLVPPLRTARPPIPTPRMNRAAPPPPSPSRP